ncbi:MAG: OmpH family outer membrane protein [Alphaproteobacteria bacterium]|nr:OmpH family outer membrane protein [Alphaproteobacteria bacterium]
MQKMMTAIALAIAAALTMVPTAQAQDQVAPVAGTPAPLILVVDQNEAVRLSAAGKDMVAQVEAYSKKMQEEFEPEQKKIANDAKQLQEQASVLDAKVREQRQKSLRDRQVSLERRVQERQAQIQGGVNKVRQQIAEALEPILKEIMIERGANLLIQRGAVVLGAIDVDITMAAIQRLNERLPKVTVELVEPPKPAEGAGQ